MQDLVKERQLADCKGLAEAWLQFRELFLGAVKGEEVITPQNEARFLAIKSRIAMTHDSFMDALKHDQQIGQNIYLIVTRCITLRHVNRMSQAETKKIEIEWHESYLLLTETLTTLQEEIDKLAQINATAFMLRRMANRVKVNVIAFLKSRFLKIVIALGAILFVIWGIPTFGIYDYDKLRDIKGVNKAYFFWLNVKRATIDKSAPYGVIEDFAGQYLPENAPPPGLAYDTQATAKQKADVEKMFTAFRLEDGRSMRDALAAATDFRAINLYKIGQQSKKAEIFLFYYRHNKEAAEIARQYEKVATASGRDFGYTVFSRNNVLVIIASQDRTMRDNEIAGPVFKQSLR